MKSEIGIYLYTGPVVSLIFSAAFFGAWLLRKESRYILLFAVTFLSFAMASLSQMLGIPSDIGRNTMISAALYAFSILCLIEGVRARLKVVGGEWPMFVIAAAIMVGLYYYFYIQRDVVARIYIGNFGYGLMFVAAAIPIARAGPYRGIDRLIFWLVLLFGLHFFPRTILTMAVSHEIYAMDVSAPGFDLRAAGAIFRQSVFWQVLNFSLLISSFMVALTLLGAVVMDIIDDLRREGRMDPLTGVANRRGFLHRVRAISADPARTSMSIVYCDIDRFKAINDTYGHAAGDRVLQQFARLLKGEIGAHDVASRFGGEEFVLLLMQANVVGAEQFAERVRQEVELTRFDGLPAHAGVTASFGVAQWLADEDLLSVMHRADRMVYEAKHAGRNRVSVDPAGRSGPVDGT